MYKVALCLSGQPRSFKEAFEYYKKNLFSNKKIEVDTFIHSWYDEKLLPIDQAQNLIELYKPKSVHFSEYFSENFFKKYIKISSPKHPANNTYHMFYSIFTANKEKKEYEQRLGFRYDWVIRSRFDYALNIKPKIIPDLKTLLLYVPDTHIPEKRDFCNDQFAMGSSETMDLYSNTFVNLDYFYNNGCVYNAEELLSENIKLYRLTGKNIVYIDMQDPFGPGKYNGTKHSLIRDDFYDWNKNRE